MTETQKILLAVLVSLFLYYLACKCMENFESPTKSGGSTGITTGIKSLDKLLHLDENPENPENSESNVKKSNVEEESGNGCGQDAMFISSNLLPKQEKTAENYFEGLNVPVDASNVDLPLERQFYSTGSCRNANLNLRSEPPNPMEAVSPWNISTITNCDSELRRPLEIGSQEKII